MHHGQTDWRTNGPTDGRKDGRTVLVALLRLKSWYPPFKNGHLTPKTLWTKSSSITRLWGQIPIFSPKISTYFSWGYGNSIKEFYSEKKVGFTRQKMGIWPQRHIRDTRNLFQLRTLTLKAFRRWRTHRIELRLRVSCRKWSKLSHIEVASKSKHWKAPNFRF